MNPEADHYFSDGCGRCPLGGTPQCKVHRWEEELALLRSIVLASGLKEELKWKVPCYTYRGKNVAIVAAFNQNCVLSFFKGALLHDRAGILEKPGENTQSARVVRFTGMERVKELESLLKAYLQEAIMVEEAGLKVDVKEKNELELPQELEEKFAEMPDLKSAFEALTPGRQRGYILYIRAAKQSKTRSARIEKHIPRILKGKGIHDP